MAIEKDGCVIIADGHQNLLEGIRNLLETMFETIIMATNRQSLFEAIESAEPDLVIVDLSLPPVDENSIAHEIKDYFPEVKYIILSIHDEPIVMREVMSTGASGYVLKQSIIMDLFDAIGKVREGRIYVSDFLKY